MSLTREMPEVRPSVGSRQGGVARDGQFCVAGPYPFRFGCICVRFRVFCVSKVVRYFLHSLGRGNQSFVRMQRYVVAMAREYRGDIAASVR